MGRGPILKWTVYHGRIMVRMMRMAMVVVGLFGMEDGIIVVEASTAAVNETSRF